LDLKGDENETNFDGIKTKISVSPMVSKFLLVILYKESLDQTLKKSIEQHLIVEGNCIHLLFEEEPIGGNDYTTTKYH
jgi:hypothetical protein